MLIPKYTANGSWVVDFVLFITKQQLLLNDASFVISSHWLKTQCAKLQI